MAQENHIIQPTSSDDTAVLRVLLHTIKGISPVSGLELVPVTNDDE